MYEAAECRKSWKVKFEIPALRSILLSLLQTLILTFFVEFPKGKTSSLPEHSLRFNNEFSGRLVVTAKYFEFYSVTILWRAIKMNYG